MKLLQSRSYNIILVILGVLLLVSMSVSADSVGHYDVQYIGRNFDAAAGNTSFVYVVTGTGADPALSHFDIEIPTCDTALQAVAYSPTDAVSFGVDPTTGVNGIKWDLPLGTNESRTYSITFSGEVLEGSVTVAVKAGGGAFYATMPGPSCTLTAVKIEKYVASSGTTTWVSSASAPGIQVDPDSQVWFRFYVQNTGTFELSGFTLSDDKIDVSSCTLPATLAPGDAFDCMVGPLPAEQGQHMNIATVSATDGNITVTDSDAAHYYGGQLDNLPITLVIVGPVSAINGTTIIIYGIEINLNDDDPLLSVIQIGDVLNISTSLVLGDDLTLLLGDSASLNIIVLAINIVFVNVEVYVNDGVVWRDSGSCNNAPPPWAPAHGWRRRCDPRGGGSGSNSGSNSRS